MRGAGSPAYPAYAQESATWQMGTCGRALRVAADWPDNAKLLLSILAAGFTRPGANNSVLRGGAGLYSMIMPTWCVGPHRNSAVSLPIETGQMCEIP